MKDATDSRCYFERVVAAGVDAGLEAWEGMPHGFVANVGKLAAAAKVLDARGNLFAQRLATETAGAAD